MTEITDFVGNNFVDKIDDWLSKFNIHTAAVAEQALDGDSASETFNATTDQVVGEITPESLLNRISIDQEQHFSDSEMQSMPESLKGLVVALGELNPSQTQEAIESIHEIYQLSAEVLELRLNNQPEAVEIEQRLRQLCIELYETLGLDTSYLSIEEFINKIIADTISANNENDQFSSMFDDEGTHEQKSGNIHFLNRLVGLLGQRSPHLELIGLCALILCVV